LEPTDTGDPPPLSRARDLERKLRREAINEAQQLAAGLHDGLGQDLTGISLLVSALRRNPAAQHPEIQKHLANIGGLMSQAMVSCRRVSEGFGGFLVRQHGLTVALLHFASQFDDERTHIEFHGRDIPAHWLDETTAHYLFGIGREAIFNAFRHSHAKSIHVTCDHADGIIHLIVEDDGVGMTETAGPDQGIGRSIMEFRARSIGAVLSYTKSPSGGVRFECTVAGAADQP
jgi:two-component system, NarL family, sensor histidine kinase UhpB